MTARKFRHIGPAHEIEGARRAGRAVAMLCGRTVHPLRPEELGHLPTCPTCEGRTPRRLSPAGFSWASEDGAA